MGEVYRARDSRFGRDVAIKIVSRVGYEHPQAFQRFERETNAAGSLNHPNVIAVYDVGKHEGLPYLVSELLEGETLADRLARGPVPPRKALEYGLQIATGLAAAHAKGIVHRDVKPSNVFVTTDGRVKLLDFGLAKLVEASEGPSPSSPTAATPITRSGLIVGTESYMSPEQIRDKPIDHRSDIFSLGAVLYEMLTGRQAFHGSSPVETMHAVLKEDPPPFSETLRGVPPSVELLVRHCLEKDPENRFQSVRDLAFDLGALLGGLRSGSTPAALRLGRSRLSGAVFRMAMPLLAVAIAAGAFLIGRQTVRTAPPLYRQLTFRHGSILSARFAPEGRTIVFGAEWDGRPVQLFSTRADGPESTPFGLPDGDILAVSSSGEMAVSLGRRFVVGFASRGTLARVPLAGGAPREVLTDVGDADWSPDGRALAVVHVVQGRHRLEYPIGNVLHETDGWISHVRVSPDGSRVAYLDHPVLGDDRGRVGVVGADRRHRDLTESWSSVNGLAWAVGGDEIWFTAAEIGANCALHAVDLAGKRRLVARTPGRLGLHDIHRDGRVLLTENKFRLRVGLKDISQREGQDRDLSWLDGSVGTDLSADGRTLLFNEQGAGAGTQSYAVYIRRTDGAPAVRLGEGSVAALSPDGQWAAAVVLTSPPYLVLLPTGPGEPKTLAPDGLADYQAVTWHPDGKRILFAGNARDRGVRVYLQDIADGKPRPISAEGMRFIFSARPVSPGGKAVATVDRQERVWLHPLDGSEPQPIAGLDPGDVPIVWSDDARSLYVFRKGELPGRVHRLDLATKRKELVAELLPSDRAGVRGITTVQSTPDGRLFVYSYSQTLSGLFLVDGLR
jgi:dipeptidyl aminopeptidase/acylaminoacyl peptidase